MTASSERDRAFLDTNVLLYAFDRGGSAKRAIAEPLVEELLRTERAVVSVQVLNEFYWVATRSGTGGGMTHEEAVLHLSRLARLCLVVSLTPRLTFQGLQAVSRYRLTAWDSLIWSAARQAGAALLYSEDFQHDQVLDGVRFINPFAASV